MENFKKQFLDRAVSIAKQVDPHLTSPNPRVGCVVVRDGKIVSEGVHERFGGPHAEVNALKPTPGLNFNPGVDEIYLTLEPCDDFEGKKTPSCTDLLMESKPKKVIIGCLDPKFEGKSVEKLRASGLKVEVMENEKCKSLNTFFVQSSKQKRPFLTLKLAQSLDGKITTNPGVEYLSNKTSRRFVHELRADHSAILTTTETVRTDDPLLNVRLDNFHRPISDPDLIVLGDRPVNENAKIFEIKNRKVHTFPNQDLRKTLEECYAQGVDSILTECGAEMATKLLKENLVNEIILFTSPIIVGTGKNTFSEEVSLKDFTLAETREFDGDVMMMFVKS
jgi:diaminohydroxyphosphoribosylaminopyrimidine deaminase / 5-amino-6-(5-phosphoribosylamino)uracil reductase